MNKITGRFIINDGVLRQEATRIVAEILKKANIQDDIQDAIRWNIDSHEWVIYTDKALMLCAYCNTADAEAMLAGQTFSTIGEHAESVAYFTLFCACQDALAQREASKARIWGQPPTEGDRG